MERGIKDRHHGQLFPKNAAAGPDGSRLGRVVQRADGTHCIDGFDGGLIDQDRVGKLVPAVGHPVAHGRDLLDAVNDAPLALHHLVQDHIKSVLVGEQVRRFFHLVAIRRFIAVFAVDADPFADALAEDRFIFHANQLVLQRRASAVDD